MLDDALRFAQENLGAVESRRKAGDASVLEVNLATTDLIEMDRQLSAATTAEAKAQATLDDTSARQAKLADASVTISANASTEGKLYGSVGPREIAEAATKQLGVTVGKSEVVMGEGPIRHTGEFEVLVHLHADVESSLKVIVVPDAA